MSKAVMISIKPKWVGLIASGQKTVEVRKTRPNIDTPFKCYIYCTKDKEYLVMQKRPDRENVIEIRDNLVLPNKYFNKNRLSLNGKIIGEFICDKIGDYVEGFSFNSEKMCISLKTQACLTPKEVWDYSGGKDLYGWHISDLKMYDKPKELSEFQMVNSYKGKWEPNGEMSKKIKRPFQSWGYVEEL